MPKPHRRTRPLAASFAFFVTLIGIPDAGRASVAGLCDHAAQVAARDTGVPLAVLRAISLTETGRKRDGRMQPWPWTVNMEGEGRWFQDPEAARAYVYKHFKAGARSFDVGCFQINYRWHGQAFDSIEQMFEPEANAQYAARFLSDLHAELGDWTEAAGAYHSRTPKFAKKYKKRFAEFKAQLEDTPPVNAVAAAVTSPPAPKRANTFPLLQAGAIRPLGSLVPQTDGRGSLFVGVVQR